MTLTEAAKNEIMNNAKFLKITVQVGGCSGMQYDLEYISQEMADNTNLVLLNEYVVTDAESFEMLKNIELDFCEEFGSKAFEITNPIAKRGCGCGNSFNL